MTPRRHHRKTDPSLTREVFTILAMIPMAGLLLLVLWAAFMAVFGAGR